MKIIASSMLVLGLLAVQVSEANAVVCARGVYRAGVDALDRMARSACIGPTATAGQRCRPPPLRLRRGSGGAPPGSRLLTA